ncbi:hypothetical protein MW887_003413 [Aspergillus wentii]|nr:hypothetical protein MW887_003413 [Aspergillus wentii]
MSSSARSIIIPGQPISAPRLEHPSGKFLRSPGAVDSSGTDRLPPKASRKRRRCLSRSSQAAETRDCHGSKRLARDPFSWLVFVPPLGSPFRGLNTMGDHLRKLTPAPPGLPADVVDNRRTNAKIACGQCRKRKSRCLGGVPCEPCVVAKTECIIDNDSDGRRKTGLKRKIEALEEDRDLLMRLLQTLRDENRSEANEVFNLIRSDAPMDHIRLRLAENFDKGNSRRKVMDVRRLADIPLFRVPAQPWTTVTDDDDLVSHLISLWFTWNYPVTNFMNRDLFIRDMKSGRLDSEYCSSFLVNIILAEACFYSDYDEIFATPGDQASRGMHFYEEAKRLLDKEEGKVTLTTFQGLGAMYICTCMIGKDRLGWMYLNQSAQAAREMTSLRSRLVGNDQGTPEMIHTLASSVMGMFSITTASSMALQKPAPHKKPQFGPLPEDHDEKDVWEPYPLQMEPVPAHTNCIINAVTNLQVILWDVDNYFFDDDEKLPHSEIEPKVDEFYARLEEWTTTVPECIALGKNTTTPGVVDLHLRYYVGILTIFGFLKNSAPTPGSAGSESPTRQLRISSALKVRELINIFCSQWRMEYFAQNFMQWAAVAAFTLLDDLSDRESSDAFIDLCIVIRSIGRRWLLSRGILRLIQLTATHHNIELPRESHSLFRDFQNDLWRTQDRKQFSSSYPNFAMTVLENDGHSVKDAELDQFLEKWDNLTLDGPANAEE